MFNNKKFTKMLYLFLSLIMNWPIIISCPAPSRVQVQRDSLLQSVTVIGAGVATYLGTKTLENFLQNQCIGQCSSYMGGAAFAAVASACSLYRYSYPEGSDLPVKVSSFLRDSLRALACAVAAKK